MSTFHERIIHLTWFDDQLPKFETEEEMQAWYAALGRLVAFGMHGRGGQSQIDRINLGITDSKEMVATYSPAAPQREEPNEQGYAPYMGSLEQQVTDRLTEIDQMFPGRRFVLGAVFHEYNQKWGFHS